MRSEAHAKAKARIARAELETDDAKDSYRRQQLARRRVDDIMSVLNSRFGGERVPRDAAEPFVQALLYALVWEQKGDRNIAVQFTANAFPYFALSELTELAATPHAMTSQDVARLLGVSLAERQRLRLAMIGACDLTDAEYAAFQKAEDKRRRAERKRRARARGLDERRADEKAKRDAIEEFAKQNGVSEKTVRNWLSAGKAFMSETRENGIPTVIVYRGDATFPAAGQRLLGPRRACAATGKACRKKVIAGGTDQADQKQTKKPGAAVHDFGHVATAFLSMRDRITRQLASAVVSTNVAVQIGALGAAACTPGKKSRATQ